MSAHLSSVNSVHIIQNKPRCTLKVLVWNIWCADLFWHTGSDFFFFRLVLLLSLWQSLQFRIQSQNNCHSWNFAVCTRQHVKIHILLKLWIGYEELSFYNHWSCRSLQFWAKVHGVLHLKENSCYKWSYLHCTMNLLFSLSLYLYKVWNKNWHFEQCWADSDLTLAKVVKRSTDMSVIGCNAQCFKKLIKRNTGLFSQSAHSSLSVGTELTRYICKMQVPTWYQYFWQF